MIICVRHSEHEIVVKKSRFIAVSRYAESRDDALSVVAALKREHVGARHVCYGYIADEKGDDFGYDDDGEPSGTAGKPIYSALAAVGARKTVIAVVRYFGGVKLGAGGLTRAYRQSAAELIESAGLVSAQKCAVYDVECDGDIYKKAAAVIREPGCNIENLIYNTNVRFTVTAPVEKDIKCILEPLGAQVRKTCERYVFEE